MTFAFELRGLLYGLLTVSTMASLTTLTTVFIRMLLPASSNSPQRNTLASVIVSWECIPILLEASYARRTWKLSIKYQQRRLLNRIAFLFLVTAVWTISAETTLILSTGSKTTTLFVPDVAPTTFLARHVVLPNTPLLSLDTKNITPSGCISKPVTIFTDDVCASYYEAVCVTAIVNEPNRTLQNWTLSTTENTIDTILLWLGVVELIETSDGRPWKEKHKYGTVLANVCRRLRDPVIDTKRLLDHDTGMRIATAVAAEINCSADDAGDPILDSDVLNRPAYIANFNCPQERTVRDIISAAKKGVFAGFGEFAFARDTPQFRVPTDRFVVDRERKHVVGIRMSESYEKSWFIGMAIVNFLGIFTWCCEHVPCLSLKRKEEENDTETLRDFYEAQKVNYSLQGGSEKLSRMTLHPFYPDFSR